MHPLRSIALANSRHKPTVKRRAYLECRHNEVIGLWCSTYTAKQASAHLGPSCNTGISIESNRMTTPKDPTNVKRSDLLPCFRPKVDAAVFEAGDVPARRKLTIITPKWRKNTETHTRSRLVASVQSNTLTQDMLPARERQAPLE